jgi:hypothetical protein
MLPPAKCPFFMQYGRLFAKVHGCCMDAPTIDCIRLDHTHREIRTGKRMKKADLSLQKVKRAMSQRFVDEGHYCENVTHENEEFYGADGILRKLKCYDVDDNIFHTCTEEGGSDGTPSAFILLGARQRTPILYCFACQKAFVILKVYETDLNECKTEHTKTSCSTLAHMMTNNSPPDQLNRVESQLVDHSNRRLSNLSPDEKQRYVLTLEHISLLLFLIAFHYIVFFFYGMICMVMSM